MPLFPRWHGRQYKTRLRVGDRTLLRLDSGGPLTLLAAALPTDAVDAPAPC